MNIVIFIFALLTFIYSQIIHGQNLILNGNFQRPNVSPCWMYFNSIPGWYGTIELGSGSLYNKNWNSQVVELDALGNAVIEQQIILQDEGLYILKYKFAKSQNAQQSFMRVYWNRQMIADEIVENDGIMHRSLLIKSKPQKNILIFEGTGKSDGYGITVDDIQLYKYIQADITPMNRLEKQMTMNRISGKKNRVAGYQNNVNGLQNKIYGQNNIVKGNGNFVMGGNNLIFQ